MLEAENSKIPVLVIFAPTATGKTEIAGRLFSDNAPSFFAGKAELISCDSMQSYKGLNIGTAKPEAEFLKHLPHHLIDVCEPTEQFGVAQFQELADEKCREIYSRGKLPVLCGGSSFYIKNFIFGLPVTPEATPEIREKIHHRMEIEGAEKLYAELISVDPKSAQKIHPNDKYRIGRALEIYYSSGKPLSSFELPSAPRCEYDFLTIFLERDREQLYERINQRVIKMFEDGLLSEVKALLQSGIPQESPGMSAIGYREFFTSGEDPLEMFHQLDENPEFAESPRFLVWVSEIKRQIQRNSRHYAKKQLMFFAPTLEIQNNPANIHQIDATDFNQIEVLVKEFMNRYFPLSLD